MARKSEIVAIYARVSSDQQAEAGTITSQVDALKQRVREDGFDLLSEHCFLDDGFSGATLMRPGLERLRDVADAAVIDRVYVHSPDRLARKYAYQVMLVDEFRRCDVDVVFLNHKGSDTPEEELLLQVQGMVAEYERAKILERSRRGKLHAARRGSVSVLTRAPYGYEYLPAVVNDGTAQLRIVLEHAKVVREIFEWIGRERMTIYSVCRRLESQGVSSPSGSAKWSRESIRHMLKNPAYKGMAAYGKTRACERRTRLRPSRNSPAQPRQTSTYKSTPQEEWISIPVPAIVSEQLFDSVQEQLAENRRVAQQHARGATYLLQGLIVCERCHYAFVGRRVKRKQRCYTYYRCTGVDGHRYGGTRVCDSTQVRTDLLDDAVWSDVCDFLQHPERLENEFERRLKSVCSVSDVQQTRSQLQRLEKGVARLIDSYADGVLEKNEFEPRIKSLRERIARLKVELVDQDDRQAQLASLKLVLTRLEDFAQRIRSGLTSADWDTRREVIRALVKRVEVDQDDVRVVYRVDPRPFVERHREKGVLQRCTTGGVA